MILKLIKTKRYLFTSLINICLLLVIGLAFSTPINKSIQSLSTWNNCESTYVAYDSRRFESNCYQYYGKEIYFNLQTGDSIRINADIYQFLESVTYDSRSIINSKNVIYGNYESLVKNQVAISEQTSKRYNLSIGSDIYLLGTYKYQVRFIYQNINDIKHPGIYESGDTIFIGSTEEPLSSNYNYAIFDNVSKVYNEVYLFAKAKEEFKSTLFGYLLINILTTLLLGIVINIIYFKSEKKQLRNYLIAGDKNNYNKTVYLLSLLIYIIPVLVSASFGLLIWNPIISISQVSTAFIIYLFHIFNIKFLMH